MCCFRIKTVLDGYECAGVCARIQGKKKENQLPGVWEFSRAIRPRGGQMM